MPGRSKKLQAMFDEIKASREELKKRESHLKNKRDTEGLSKREQRELRSIAPRLRALAAQERILREGER